MHIRFFIYLLVGVVLVSCGQTPEPAPVPEVKPVQQEVPLKTGEVIPHISELRDVRRDFSLYLPSAYPGDSSLAVLLLFDPHGDGKGPVEAYHELAEKYGFILAGSNTSQNGQSIEESRRTINSLVEDVNHLLTYDHHQLYTGGFSGGARIAGMAAMYQPGVSGAIACGAGLPPSHQPPVNNFCYYALVGNGDFNLYELQALDSLLLQTPIPHHLEVFDGKHEWPSATHMEHGFLFLKFTAMKSGRIPEDAHKEWVDAYAESSIRRVDSLQQHHLYLAAGEALLQRIRLLEGLMDITGDRKRLKTLQSDPGYIKAQNRQNSIKSEENKIREQYMLAFQGEDIQWWKNEIQRLKKKDADPEQEAMHQRLLAWASISAYTYSNSMLRNGNLQVARQFLDQYAVIDPPNPEHAYLLAVVEVREHHPEAAISKLNEAVQLGFNDLARLQSDPDLQVLANQPDYQTLLEKISAPEQE
ncbi:MAG: hypothetical protein H6585_13420 [Flavobacteriales bacterium]|nr:hypothetical protein [Flavobacteriales bacterium]MCB9449334.1 hypothetical protein [Flavobacteriales bacterium]